MSLFAVFYFLFWIVGGLTLLFASIFYFDRRYKRRRSKDDGRPGNGFHPTSEVFIDPKDGMKYRVYYNPYTGERDYIRES